MFTYLASLKRAVRTHRAAPGEPTLFQNCCFCFALLPSIRKLLWSQRQYWKEAVFTSSGSLEWRRMGGAGHPSCTGLIPLWHLPPGVLLLISMENGQGKITREKKQEESLGDYFQCILSLPFYPHGPVPWPAVTPHYPHSHTHTLIMTPSQGSLTLDQDHLTFLLHCC